jgi:signal transduction histidine kinase
MNAVAIHLELLRNQVRAEDSADDQSQRSIAALDSSIHQLDRLVRDFTAYSEPLTLERKAIDVAEVLAASIDSVTSQCAAQNIALTRDLAPGPWPGQGDAARLRQSFDNLLRNAMEAQPNGGTVRVSARKNGAELLMDFCDGGPGVPPERQSELFEFGKTTKAGGSGIGLPLSQLIVEAHGGSLTYHDGNGATFRVTLAIEVR